MVDASTPSRRLLTLLLVLLLVAALASAAPAYANGEEDEYEDEYEGSDLAEGLGEAAWSIGAPLVGLYVVYRFLLRLEPQLVARVLNPVLARKLHTSTSLLFGGMALGQAYLNRAYATPLEYALVSVLAVTLVSGVLLYKAASLPGEARRLAYRLHAQRLLALTLLILAALHVAVRD